MITRPRHGTNEPQEKPVENNNSTAKATAARMNNIQYNNAVLPLTLIVAHTVSKAQATAQPTASL